MRKLRRGLVRRKKRWMSSMASVAMAAALAGGTAGMEVQPIYGAEITEENTEQTEDEGTEAVKAIYLDGVQGSNENDGTTVQTAVKTFTKAKKLAKKSGVSTIYVTGTITVTSSTEWYASGLTIKKASGFSGPIVSVAKGAVLTLGSRFIAADDMKLADDSCLVVEGEQTQDDTEKEENKKEENKKDETDKTEDKGTGGNTNEDQTDKEDKEEEEEKEPVKKKAKDIQVPDTFTMETQQEVGSLSLEECSGNGTFYWADSSYVPENQEKCTIIFKPNDTDTYDYSHLEGWNSEKQVIRRKVTIVIKQTVPPEEEEEKKPEEEEKTVGKDNEERPAVTEPKENPSEEEEKELEEPKQEKAEEENRVRVEETVQISQRELQNTLLNGEAEMAAASITEAVNRAQAGDIYQLIQATKEFESLTQEVQDRIPQDVKNRLTGAQESARGTLLSCNGLTVTGDFIPWYVQFKAELRPNAELTEDMNVQEILASYELKLWDLMNDTEYEIPEGQKVTVRMKVDGISLFDELIIVHTLKDGSKEYITPVAEGDWLTFETSSFSPFEVAGSKVIVGTVLPETGSSAGTGISDSLTGTKNTQSNLSSGTSAKSTAGSSGNASSDTRSKTSAPKTGDGTTVLPYVIGFGAGAVIIVLAAAVKKKKKRNKE